MIPDTYSVERIPGGVGKEFVRLHHYTRGCHNGPMTWGLKDSGRLIGVLAFANPSSENVRSSVFGIDHRAHVTELHRLVILDETPPNVESWMISRALAGLKRERPNYWAVLSFADATEGHRGVIYQATNALYMGSTNRARFWRDGDGRLRHPRQNGHKVTPAEAQAFGWSSEMRESKHRYLFLLPDSRRHRKWMLEQTAARVSAYPKAETA